MICKNCGGTIVEEQRYPDSETKVWVHVRGDRTKAGRSPVLCGRGRGTDQKAEPFQGVSQ